MHRSQDNPAVEREIAQKALSNVWSIPLFGELPVYGDTDVPLHELWQGKPIDNLSWQLSVHSLFILRNLVFAHQDTGNGQYLEKGKEIVESWIKNNPPNDSQCEYSWSDHSSANRALLLCAFLDYCNQSGIEDQGFTSLVAESLLQHGLFLLTPWNYTYSHNHGIYQDYALLAIATHLEVPGLSREWMEIALGRLQKQIESTYSTDGIHLENSPGYHQSITELLDSIVVYMYDVGLAPPKIVVRTLVAAKAAMTGFVMPDLSVVPVGDTWRGDTARLTQSRMQNNFIVYPRVGYGVIADVFHTFFTASHNNSFAHKHCDDLSIIVSDQQGTIIGEAGFLNYQLNDPRRDYTLSWQAHNTVVADSETPLEMSLRCGIDAYGKTDKFMFIRGKSLRKAGQVHIRSLLYDTENQALLIIDRCRSAVPEKWERMFHFEPGIVTDFGNSRAVIRTPWDNSYVLSLAPSGASTQMVIGRGKPLQGWVAREFGELIPAPVLVESQTGTDVVFLAALERQDVTNSIKLTPDNHILYNGMSFHRAISIQDDSVKVASVDIRKSSDADNVAMDKIELTASELRDPATQQRAPIRFQKRLMMFSLNAFLWCLVVIFIKRTRISSYTFCLALLILLSSVNAVAIVWAAPRLAWW